MARSTNILLACVAMLGAMLLAIAMTPHNLMARTHDVFDIDKHLPTQFGDWKPVEGLNVVAPPAPDSLERHALQSGGVARLCRSRRACGDADGRLWREPERPSAAASSGGVLHRAGLPRVADEPVQARLFPLGAAAQSDEAGRPARGADRADQLLDADRLRQFEQQLGPPGAEARIRPQGMGARRRAVPGVDHRHSGRTRASRFRTSSFAIC